VWTREQLLKLDPVKAGGMTDLSYLVRAAGEVVFGSEGGDQSVFGVNQAIEARL
jgi:hypothetical protein